MLRFDVNTLDITHQRKALMTLSKHDSDTITVPLKETKAYCCYRWWHHIGYLTVSPWSSTIDLLQVNIREIFGEKFFCVGSDPASTLHVRTQPRPLQLLLNQVFFCVL